MLRLLILGFAFLCASAQAQNQNIQLLTANKLTGPILQWPGGIGAFSCTGTWGGATVTLEYVGPDGVTMIVAGTYTTLTANGGGVFNLYITGIQAVVSGATSTTNLTCSAGQVTQALPP